MWKFKQACSCQSPFKDSCQSLTVASSLDETNLIPSSASIGLTFQTRAVCPYIVANCLSPFQTLTVLSSETLATNSWSVSEMKHTSKITPVWPSSLLSNWPVSECQISSDLKTVPAATSPLLWMSPEYKMQFSSRQKTRLYRSLQFVSQCSTKLWAKSSVNRESSRKTLNIVSITDR